MSVEAAPQPDVVDLEEQLESLVGMSELKKGLRDFHKKCQDDVSFRIQGHKPLHQSYHMLLMGNPGTGKTTVARLLFRMLKSAGVLKSDAPFVEIKPSRAEGIHMGEAGEKAREEIKKAKGGVLFADEAHQLTMHKDNRYGYQVASELMNCLQDGDNDETSRVIVIYAGYKAGMQTLMNSDPGYRRRIPIGNQFTLPDYTPSELAEIFLKMAKLECRQIGKDVTLATVAAQIKACTNPEYRSKHNGSIAEMLLEYTDKAMRDRKRPYNFEGPLIFEAEDVQLGAKALKAAFDKFVATAGRATTAAHAVAAAPAAAAAHATTATHDGAQETEDEEARKEARALPRTLPSHPTHTLFFEPRSLPGYYTTVPTRGSRTLIQTRLLTPPPPPPPLPTPPKGGRVGASAGGNRRHRYRGPGGPPPPPLPNLPKVGS